LRDSLKSLILGGFHSMADMNDEVWGSYLLCPF